MPLAPLLSRSGTQSRRQDGVATSPPPGAQGSPPDGHPMPLAPLLSRSGTQSRRQDGVAT
jgi:hypothetical protein